MSEKKQAAPVIEVDDFARELEAIPEYRALMHSFTLCPECELCERSIVYLTPSELESAKRVQLPLHGNGGATRINVEGCACPYYDVDRKLCAEYTTRPLICRLFPLDIIENEDDGEFWWVVFEACAEVGRGRLRGKIDELRALAKAVDARMPIALKRAITADHDDVVAEPAFYDAPVHYLVRATFE